MNFKIPSSQKVIVLGTILPCMLFSCKDSSNAEISSLRNELRVKNAEISTLRNELRVKNAEISSLRTELWEKRPLGQPARSL